MSGHRSREAAWAEVGYFEKIDAALANGWIDEAEAAQMRQQVN